MMARLAEGEDLAFVVACSDGAVLARHLLASPDLAGGGQVLTVVHGASSAAEAMGLRMEQGRLPAWLVWVHQDVYLPAGWVDRFRTALAVAEAGLGRVDVVGAYGVADGAAGFARAGRVLHHDAWLNEPAPLPCEVQSFDELLIALRSDSGLGFDPDLGFDFYGTDVALAARAAGRRAVVLDIPCEHHTRTALATLTPALLERLRASGRRFLDKWRHALPVHTPCVALDREEDLEATLQWYAERFREAPSSG